MRAGAGAGTVKYKFGTGVLKCKLGPGARAGSQETRILNQLILRNSYMNNTFVLDVCYIIVLSLSVGTSNRISALLQFIKAIYIFIYCAYFSKGLNNNNDRSSHQRWAVRKGVLRNFVKFTGKHLCQSLFFNKVAETLAQAFFCEFSKIFKNTFFVEHLRATASVVKHFQDLIYIVDLLSYTLQIGVLTT